MEESGYHMENARVMQDCPEDYALFYLPDQGRLGRTIASRTLIDREKNESSSFLRLRGSRMGMRGDRSTSTCR